VPQKSRVHLFLRASLLHDSGAEHPVGYGGSSTKCWRQTDQAAAVWASRVTNLDSVSEPYTRDAFRQRVKPSGRRRPLLALLRDIDRSYKLKKGPLS